MSEKLGQPALQDRLTTLQNRISGLRSTIGQTSGIEKIEAGDRLADLEARQQSMAERLREMDAAGGGMWQGVKAELDLMADDLSGSVDALLAWIEGQRPGQHGGYPAA